MAKKAVSFFIGSTNDHVNSIDNVTYDMSIADLLSNNPGVFWTEQNPNGQTDLCTEIEDTVTKIFGEFVESSTSNTYSLGSEDFVEVSPGIRHPKNRCPDCP